MSELRELYQQLIIDHGRHPRNFGTLADANAVKEGYNPLCGDKLKLYLKLQDGRIADVKFEGVGCAISMASASLMTQLLMGKTTAEADEIFQQFHALVTSGHADDEAILGKLKVLAGVAEYPSRVKCATLCWHTMEAAIHHDASDVTTE